MIWPNVKIEMLKQKFYGKDLAALSEGTLDLMMTEHS
jgi:hypothetical protein